MANEKHWVSKITLIQKQAQKSHPAPHLSIIDGPLQRLSKQNNSDNESGHLDEAGLQEQTDTHDGYNMIQTPVTDTIR